MFFNRSNTPFFLALLAGAILPLAFAPKQIWPLAFLSPAVLLWVWQNTPPKQALWLGFCFGVGLFGVGVSWVYVSIHHYGHTEVPLALFITGLFIVVLSIFPALNGYLLARFFPKSDRALWFVGFPASWVLLEWLRSWIFTGFPWLYLGYSQIDSPLAEYAPLLSVYGVSLAVLLCSGALVALFTKKSDSRLLACVILIALFGGGFFLSKQTWTYREGPVHTVALVQSNVDPLNKFPENDPNPTASIEQIYGSLTNEHWWNDFIIWPESAIPVPLPDPNTQSYIDQLNQKAKDSNTTLIVGLQIIKENKYYNAMMALGNGEGVYYKRHLVAFGEFLPFDKWLRGLINFFDLPMSDFYPGPEDQPLLQSGYVKIEPLICYEIAFPELVRSSLKEAQMIVNISEDGWFGTSWGPYQHLQIARMRAKETGRPVLRATTSGISAIIDHTGKLVATSPQFQAMVLTGEFQTMNGSTPWVQIGLWPLLGVLGFFVCFN